MSNLRTRSKSVGRIEGVDSFCSRSSSTLVVITCVGVIFRDRANETLIDRRRARRGERLNENPVIALRRALLTKTEHQGKSSIVYCKHGGLSVISGLGANELRMEAFRQILPTRQTGPPARACADLDNDW